MTEQTAPLDATALLAQIRKKSALIVRQQRIADTEGFSDMGGALSLQHIRMERSALQAKLPPLRLIA